MLLSEKELKFLARSTDFIAGMDEAGRGPWAGPVTAAIVIVNKPQLEKLSQLGINDSKILSVKKRDFLFDLIIEIVESYAIFDISHTEIDATNILIATQNAMNNAYRNTRKEPDFTFIDGYFKDKFDFDKYECVIDGDAIFVSIAAASILAKVHRDRLMDEMSKKYPDYGFEKHKGYGTKVHMEALGKYGICDIHRKSFKPIKKFL